MKRLSLYSIYFDFFLFYTYALTSYRIPSLESDLPVTLEDVNALRLWPEWITFILPTATIRWRNLSGSLIRGLIVKRAENCLFPSTPIPVYNGTIRNGISFSTGTWTRTMIVRARERHQRAGHEHSLICPSAKLPTLKVKDYICFRFSNHFRSDGKGMALCICWSHLIWQRTSAGGLSYFALDMDEPVKTDRFLGSFGILFSLKRGLSSSAMSLVITGDSKMLHPSISFNMCTLQPLCKRQCLMFGEKEHPFTNHGMILHFFTQFFSKKLMSSERLTLPKYRNVDYKAELLWRSFEFLIQCCRTVMMDDGFRQGREFHRGPDSEPLKYHRFKLWLLLEVMVVHNKFL